MRWIIKQDYQKYRIERSGVCLTASAFTLWTFFRVLPVLILLWGGRGLYAAEGLDVESRFDPPVITQGEATVFKIIINGAMNGRLEGQLPNVRGLRTLDQNRSSKLQLDLGSVLKQTIYSFRMRADKPGDYRMPAFSVRIDGQSYTVPEAVLKVAKPRIRSVDRPLSLSFNVPTETLYVGQTVPFDVLIHHQPDIELKFNRYPVKQGDAFTDPPFKKFIRGEDPLLNGKRYGVYRLPSALTTLKTGDHPLSFHLDLLVSMPDTRRGRSFDPFGFFNEFDRTTLYTETKNYTIEPLPLKGKPDDFTGAIGLFSIRPNLSSTQVQVGDPLTLKLEVTGEGNFDRIQAPDLAFGNDWKTYDPKSSFQPNDTIGYKGIKTFEYILIPKSEKITKLPKIPFNFFSPEDAEYIEVLLPSIPLTITPAKNRNWSVPSPQYFEDFDTSEKEQLLPLMQVSNPNWVKSIRPLSAVPLFWLGQLVPLVVLLLLYGIRRRLRLQNDPAYARRQRGTQAMKYWRQTAEKASTGNDAVAFFTAAQRAIQESLGRVQSTKAEALTPADIKVFLNQKNAEIDLIDTVMELLQAVDNSRFSGASTKVVDLHLYQGKLNSILKRLEKLV